MKFAGIIIAAVLVPVLTGLGIGLALRRRVDSSFRNAVDTLNPDYMKFYGRLYAAADYNGLHFSFTSGTPAGSVSVISPAFGKRAISASVRIPGTAGVKLHLAVVPEETSGFIRDFTGWKRLEPGFSVASVRGSSIEESAGLFMKLSASTKSMLKDFAARHGSCSITADWNSIMIGRENSIKLCRGDSNIADLLELNTWLPADIDRNEFLIRLEKISGAVKQISAELNR